ncbi:MAG: hypothetical protein ACTSRZ_10445 [Promethearchaeota archaeon]
MEKFYTISQIDNMKGIKTPHEADLKDIVFKRIKILRQLNEELIEEILVKIDGFKENIDYGQDWIISKEIFKDAYIHILYMNYEDEEDELFDEVDEIQFLFSGDNILMISGEDLAHFCEIILDFILYLILKQSYDNQIKNIKEEEDGIESFQIWKKPSNMLIEAIRERSAPFFELKDIINFKEMAKFIGGKMLRNYVASDDKNLFAFMYNPFPSISIVLRGESSNSDNEKGNMVKVQIEGEGVKYIPPYNIERLAIMALNQCLRYMYINLYLNYKNTLKKYQIFKKMFSGFYIKTYPDKF